MTSGPVLIGIPGKELDAKSRCFLRHPAVGGVVLFARNFSSHEQLIRLLADIHECAEPRPLVCIDQEGGRVQRLAGEGFTSLPPLAVLGRLRESDPVKALDMAYRHGRVMAMEMLVCGIDLSFAPVLDLDRGSRVIGDRALSADPSVVTELGRSYLAGMHDAGMKTTGKHFPGHGSVVADSHVEDVMDARPLDAIRQADLLPFGQLMPALDALMIAHVVYPQVDGRPAGYSQTWLQDILRGELGYRGVVLSDGLGMHAAKTAGSVSERAESCLQAGCDLVLVCEPQDVENLLAGRTEGFGDASEATGRLYGKATVGREELLAVKREGIREWEHWRLSLEQLNRQSWS
ncbi:MAG: beta-N-acetylhexosaminidase [Xanthomonadales bacterium]|jgi:beta-N-acetylhexosaminidase|nr:beta-N-acetylhexosaminidase [Xanthomonadales bacterium]